MLNHWLIDIGMRDRASLEDLAERSSFDHADTTTDRQPELHFLKRESKQLLVAALAKLPQREQQLLYLYYQEELTLKEIGYVLDLSESQVSRTHKKALSSLQKLLAEDD